MHLTMALGIENPEKVLAALVTGQNYADNTCYISQSTGHDWLDESFSKIADPVTGRIELLVKYFTVMEKIPLGLLNHTAEGSHPDPVAPFVHSSKSQDNI